MKRGFLQISFGWLFALIVGAIVIFLAIFLVNKFSSTENASTSAKTSTEIGILLNPLETGFESATTSSFAVSSETKIFNECDEDGTFGYQTIQTSQKTFNKWEKTGIDVTFENKYIFSDKEVQGKMFYLFSKPLELPFKVSDLVYLSSASDTYCFVNAPDKIEEELSNLNQENILLGLENCTETSIKVCFSSSNCDVNVKYNLGYVKKGDETFYFKGDALMYAAIFADKDIYECQVSRLMKRLTRLVVLYEGKEEMLYNEGCELDISFYLTQLKVSAISFSDSSSLNQIFEESNTADNKNEELKCRLW